jgi:NADH-quinone oxidoreductase subunit C
MTPAEIADRFQARLGAAVLETKIDGIHPFVRVAPASWADAARFAREDLHCEMLHDLTAVDGKDTMTVMAQLWSFANRHWVRLKAEVPRGDPRIASLVPLWNAADWHERECWDMFGVRFEGHPNLKRILCAEDWVGHPLRKDYQYPAEYHGIPGIPVMRARDAEGGRVFPPKKKAVPAPAAKPAAAPAAPAAAAAPAPAASTAAPAAASAPAAAPPPPPPPGGGA